MMSTDFVQFNRLHEALKLIGFEHPYDTRTFHSCPDQKSYIDVQGDPIKTFMNREDMKKYKDIFQYIHEEFRKMGLKSINVRNRISNTINGKRRKYKTWSLHEGSSCADTFQYMSSLLIRQRGYLEGKSYLNIDFHKIEDITTKNIIGVKRKR